MINLIRNELCKILHKKAIYFYTTIVLVMLIGVSVFSKYMMSDDSGFNDTYTATLEENLDNYDLKDEDELNMFIGDKVIIDVNNLTKDYKFESPERYFIDEVIEPLIYNKYQLKYAEKNEEGAKAVQIEIDNAIKRLDNFDWKKDIKERINEIELEIKELKDTKDNDYLETLKIELWCLNYRIDNKVPYSYSSTSSLVDQYKDSALQYLSVVKDESLIKDDEVLRDKRRIEESYYESLYKLEHKMTGDSQDTVDFIIDSIAYIDGLIIIAIVIIAGSIISDEFGRGTIKQLLIKPHSRAKILTSKIIASLLVIFMFIIIYNGVFILANCYEASDFSIIVGNNVVYDFNLGKAKEISFIGHCLYSLLSVLPAYLIIYFLVIFVGILSTSTIATICSALGIYFFYDLLSLGLKPQVLAYLPFYCWDLSPFMFGGLSSNKYSSFGLSITVDIITIVVLLVLSYILFKKKEIKNQ